jgi:glyoxylase-like metal-dependent hydrolase (beta-lactamase superfamily II)
MPPMRLELPTGLQVGSVNAYLFTAPEPVLVDAGIKSEACWAALEAGLAAHGLSVSDLARVVITHAHIDHYGLVGRIAAASTAEIWANELSAPWLTDESQWETRYAYYRDAFLPRVGLPPEMSALILQGLQGMRLQRDVAPAARVRTFPMNGVLALGGLTWQVIHTPGHASMQTIFYQSETRQLLSADMLLATTPTPVVEGAREGTERVPALPQFMRSLDLVERLAVDVVYPGHGRPFHDHRAVIQRQRARIWQRTAECLHWVTAGCRTLPELLDKMYAHRPLATRFAGLWMLIGYLDLLIGNGQITQRTEEGRWRYDPV